MKDLGKVNASQLMGFWKQFTSAMIVMIGTLILSKVFPYYCSPVIGLIAAALLYTMLYNNKLNSTSACALIPYAMFYCMITYSFICIILNILDIWTPFRIPKELSFLNDPYIAALLLDPVCLLVLLFFYVRRNRLGICIDCKISRGLAFERGKLGEILSHESKLQLVNMIWLFLILSILVWVYLFVGYYTHTTVNSRDWYIFLWINVIAIVLDELYFTSRYYNLYLDLKESGEIITPEELSDMSAKTYLRFYVICGDYLYVNRKVADFQTPGRYVIDTPFVTKRNVNGISMAEVRQIIDRLTGVKDGELRFFYGRNSVDLAKHRLLRYFYFLKGEPTEYHNIEVEGEWVDFTTLKQIYSKFPTSMSPTLLADMSRMITIVLTQKIFNEEGYRRIKVKSYKPNVTLTEIRDKDYDFQDDKWIRISIYNADVRSFHIRRWFERLFNRRKDRKMKTEKEWQKNQ